MATSPRSWTTRCPCSTGAAWRGGSGRSRWSSRRTPRTRSCDAVTGRLGSRRRGIAERGPEVRARAAARVRGTARGRAGRHGSPGARCSMWSRGSIARSAERMIRFDAGVRLGEDPEAVHQARVATRRLRSDLRTFRQPARSRSGPPICATELGWLGAELGKVRDLDVLGERLRGRHQGAARRRRRGGAEAPRPGPHRTRGGARGPDVGDARAPLPRAAGSGGRGRGRARGASRGRRPRTRRDVDGRADGGPWGHLERICRAARPGSPTTPSCTRRGSGRSGFATPPRA